jgi:hypothetical protein
VRIALIVLFAFANILGPWLCCCAPAKLFAPRTPIETAKAKKVLCPHCKEAKPDAPPREEPKPPAKPCPCRDQQPPEIIAIDVKQHWTISTSISLPFSTVFVPVPFDFLAPNAFAVLTSELPFLTADERLRVHHVMLC